MERIQLKSLETLYLLGVNLALRAGDEHYALHRLGGCTPSQLSFEVNDCNIRCLVYCEDCITKTNRGGICDMKKERKVVWIKPNTNLVRCPVRLVEKYLSLILYGGMKGNLYVQSFKRPKPSMWYSTQPVGINKICKVISSMLRNAGLDGFFTNHSLCRTCATRLFQAGQSSKLVKEITGHISDAVDKYQVTSDAQRMALSSIVQGNVNEVKLSQSEPMQVVDDVKSVSNEEKCKLPKLVLPVKMSTVTKNCECKANSNEQAVAVGNLVESAVHAIGNRRAKVTIEVQLME